MKKKLSKIFVWILAVIIAFISYYIFNKPKIVKKDGYTEIRVGNKVYINKNGIIERIK